MEVLLTVAIFAYMYVCATACSRIASRKHRGTEEWFVCGEILGLFAVIAVLFLPPLKDTRRYPPASGSA